MFSWQTRKFRVRIEGRNLLMETHGLARLGYVATRYVQGRDTAEAAGRALDLVRKELNSTASLLNSVYDPPVITVSEIAQLRSFKGVPVPGAGLIFFPEQKDRSELSSIAVNFFDVFCEWGEGAPWEGAGDVRFHVGQPCDNRSAGVDIDTPESVAGLVVWTSGDYFAEIIDSATEQCVYTKSGILLPGQRLEEVFACFFETLGIRLKQSAAPILESQLIMD